jgi:hypothetical protein
MKYIKTSSKGRLSKSQRKLVKQTRNSRQQRHNPELFNPENLEC